MGAEEQEGDEEPEVEDVAGHVGDGGFLHHPLAGDRAGKDRLDPLGHAVALGLGKVLLAAEHQDLDQPEQDAAHQDHEGDVEAGAADPHEKVEIRIVHDFFSRSWASTTSWLRAALALVARAIAPPATPSAAPAAIAA